jgi:hypothetical protein
VLAWPGIARGWELLPESAVDKCHERLWQALVDLRENENGWNPEVFFVRSFLVGQFVKADFSRML